MMMSHAGMAKLNEGQNAQANILIVSS